MYVRRLYIYIYTYVSVHSTPIYSNRIPFHFDSETDAIPFARFQLRFAIPNYVDEDKGK